MPDHPPPWLRTRGGFVELGGCTAAVSAELLQNDDVPVLQRLGLEGTEIEVYGGALSPGAMVTLQPDAGHVADTSGTCRGPVDRSRCAT